MPGCVLPVFALLHLLQIKRIHENKRQLLNVQLQHVS
jgi:glucan phosphorylase